MKQVPIGDVLSRTKDSVSVDPTEEYKQITIRLHHKGAVLRQVALGSQIASQQYLAREGQFILSGIDARNGAFALVPPELDRAIVTNDFWVFDIDSSKILPQFLDHYAGTARFRLACEGASEGTTNRVRLKPKRFERIRIPLPSLEEQKRINDAIDSALGLTEKAVAVRARSSDTSAVLWGAILRSVFSSVEGRAARLGEMVEKGTGQAYKSQDFSEFGGVPVVKLAEIQTHAPTSFLTNPDAYNNVWVEKGDLVLAKTSFSTGEMCLWRGPRSVLNQNAVRLRALAPLMQDYLFFWLQYQVQSYLKSRLADPNFYPYIREKDLFGWEISVPPETKQVAVIELLRHRWALVREIEKIQSRVAKHLTSLSPSVLNQRLCLSP